MFHASTSMHWFAKKFVASTRSLIHALLLALFFITAIDFIQAIREIE